MPFELGNKVLDPTVKQPTKFDFGSFNNDKAEVISPQKQEMEDAGVGWGQPKKENVEP